MAERSERPQLRDEFKGDDGQQHDQSGHLEVDVFDGTSLTSESSGAGGSLYLGDDWSTVSIFCILARYTTY
jgi:hypothetical protein